MKAFPDFRSAAAAVLDYLHRRLGFDLWMVTRVEGQEWIILQVEDHGYGIKSGMALKWADSFCIRMIEGQGPCVSPRVLDVPAYAAAPVGQVVKVGAYIGIPIMKEDGSLFGTLCAIHPSSQPDMIVMEQPMIELFTRLLGTILAEELKTLEGARRDERTSAGAHRDPQTGLFGREAWETLVRAEERRCVDYGNPAAVAVVTLRASDRQLHEGLLERAAGALTQATREQDVLARVGDHQFAVLAVECDRAGMKALVGRLTDALAEVRIDASISVSHRCPPRTLWHSWREAEGEAEGNSRDHSHG
ncbi:MAG TPA: diguanylate cyclase [Tepidisphaeraceae bacterium]|nr:diguanylate cyclase [Tepidisphaeraceae bacterium]